MSIFGHFWWIILHLHTTMDTVRGLALSKQRAQQAKSVFISVNVCRKTWCLTSTETIRFIRDGTSPPPPSPTVCGHFCKPNYRRPTVASRKTGPMPASVSVQFSSVQFKMVAMRSEKPICAPPRLSDVSPVSPLKRFCVTMSVGSVSVQYDDVYMTMSVGSVSVQYDDVCMMMAVGSVSVQYDDGCWLSVSAVWRWLLAQCQCSMTMAVGSVSVQYDDGCWLSVSAVWRWLLAQCQCSMTMAVDSVSVQYDDGCWLSVSAVWRWLLTQCQCSMTMAVGSVPSRCSAVHTASGLPTELARTPRWCRRRNGSGIVPACAFGV